MPPVALQPTGETASLKFTTISKFIAKPTKPPHVDPLAKERRRRLLELTKQPFPDGKVPDPFSLAWLSLSQDVAANKLPFVLALRIIVASATDTSDNPPQYILESASGILVLRPHLLSPASLMPL
jgi:hypothetical protein